MGQEAFLKLCHSMMGDLGHGGETFRDFYSVTEF